MAEIQSRLAYVSCIRQLESVKKATFCQYIRPPIDRYQTLDFHMFDIICELGYQHGKGVFDVWTKSSRARQLLDPKLHHSSIPHPHMSPKSSRAPVIFFFFFSFLFFFSSCFDFFFEKFFIFSFRRETQFPHSRISRRWFRKFNDHNLLYQMVGMFAYFDIWGIILSPPPAPPAL